MRIPILYLHESPAVAGAENSLCELTSRLDKGSFEPLVACPVPGAFATLLSDRGVTVIPLVFPKVRALRGVFRTLAAVRRIIRERGVRIVHSNSIRTHIYGALAGKPQGAKVVWHERNLIEREWVDPDRVLGFVPDAVICNSRAIAGRFATAGILPRKVTVIHNGVDTARFNPTVSGHALRNEYGIDPHAVVVGIASRFNRNKGHETFLEAARIILSAAAVPPPTFLIAGGGVFAADKERESVLKNLCAEKRIAQHVVFAGLRADMPPVYAAMDIFVLASEAEPCGRVVLEAMASGKPVIGTDAGGTAEMVAGGETGLLFKPGDAGALARHITHLIRDTGARAAMAAASRARVLQAFSITRHVSATEELYTELLGAVKTNAC